MPWFVNVAPEYYDDREDAGFNWEGWATGEDDAVRKALRCCHEINERGPDELEADIDPDRATVYVAEIDFRQLAGPLLYWARSMGGWDTPVWNLMEAAVREARLEVAPLANRDPESPLTP